MKPIPLPTQSLLKERFLYDACTGKLTWKECGIEHFKTGAAWKKFHSYSVNTEAFTSLDGEGYLYGGLTIKGKRRFYKAHRIVWKMVHGYDPDQLDHDNRIRTDNRISNLKLATAQSNAKNRKMRSDNTTGYTGIELTPAGKFVVRFAQEYIGTFDTASEAQNARERLKSSKGYHQNHGFN